MGNLPATGSSATLLHWKHILTMRNRCGWRAKRTEHKRDMFSPTNVDVQRAVRGVLATI
jgi:hypothetical protein